MGPFRSGAGIGLIILVRQSEMGCGSKLPRVTPQLQPNYSRGGGLQ